MSPVKMSELRPCANGRARSSPRCSIRCVVKWGSRAQSNVNCMYPISYRVSSYRRRCTAQRTAMRCAAFGRGTQQHRLCVAYCILTVWSSEMHYRRMRLREVVLAPGTGMHTGGRCDAPRYPATYGSTHHIISYHIISYHIYSIPVAPCRTQQCVAREAPVRTASPGILQYVVDGTATVCNRFAIIRIASQVSGAQYSYIYCILRYDYCMPTCIEMSPTLRRPASAGR
jgi:hypothetical protein